MGGRGVLLTSNLPQLQNLIKRDPVSYKEEFLQQWNHYDSIRQIFQINPDEQAQHFRELVSFISQVRLKDLLQFSYFAEDIAISGRTMLSQGNQRFSISFVYPSPRKLWHPHARYQKNPRPKPCYVAQQRCYYIHRVSALMDYVL